jgi:hypothetical protein
MPRDWVAIAFLNRAADDREREKENERNKKTQEIALDYVDNRPLFIRLRDKIIMLFLSIQKYKHIEIAFPCDSTPDGDCVTFGVFSDGNGIKERIRKFTNPAYEWLELTVTDKEYDILMNFCRARVSFVNGTQERAYDETSLFMSQIWPTERENKYWCVSFVIAALQEIGMFRYYNKNTFTIDEAVEYLKKHHKIKAGLPPRILSEQRAKVKKSLHSTDGDKHISLFK